MPQQVFTLKGHKQAIKDLRKLAAEVPDRLTQALRIEAEAIMARSKSEFVPVDLGTLRASGTVKPVKRSGTNYSVTLYYGGPSAPYALAVHEHPSEHSPPSWRGKGVEDILAVRTRIPWSLDGRGPKYLERPLLQAMDGMAERLGARILAA